MISRLKAWLPKPLKIRIIALREKSRFGVVWLFSRNRLLSSLYYCLFSRQFAREHHAVLNGRLHYLRQQGVGVDSNTLLRRNIHRIEKGLIMQPRKAVFALDYIEDTLRAFNEASGNEAHDRDELNWATDVLTTYFATVDLAQMDPQLKLSFETTVKGSDSDGLSVPYTFASKIKAPVNVDDFQTLCIQRRSVRWFEDRAVDRALLERAITIAALAPSACNRQPFNFFIADSKAASQRLVSIPGGTKGFAENVPCTIVVTADLAHYPTERDRHLVYIDGALAAMQLLLALETLGLSSCPINFPDIEQTERKMARALNLAASVRPVMLIAVGYGLANGRIPFSHKKSAEQLIRYINFE